MKLIGILNTIELAFPSLVKKLVFFSVAIAVLEAIGVTLLASLFSILSNNSGGKITEVILLALNNFPFEHFNIQENFLVVLCVFFIFKGVFVIGSRWLINHQVFFAKRKLELAQGAEMLEAERSHDPVKLVNDVMSETLIFTFNVLQAIVVLITEVVVAAAIILLLLSYEPTLFFALVLPLCLALALGHQLFKSHLKRWGEHNEKNAAHIVGILETLSSARTEILLHDLKTYFLQRMTAYTDAVARTYRNSQTVAMAPQPVMEVILILLVAFIALFALHSPQANQSSIELLSLYAAAAFRLLPSLSRILSSLSQIDFGDRSLRLLGCMFPKEKNLDSDPGALDDWRKIVMSDVSFGYREDQPQLLTNLNITISKGERIAIVGPSGSGKSTLIELILGLKKPSRGLLSVDGSRSGDGCVTSVVALNHQVGYVPQEVYILDDNLFANIAFGIEEALIDRNRLLEIVQGLGLTDVLTANGITGKLGNRGSKVSGGQRTRIGIARALYSQPSILVLDESTSSLDETTEKMILENYIFTLSRQMTVIIVTHRESSAMDADTLWRLNNSGSLSVLHLAEMQTK